MELGVRTNQPSLGTKPPSLKTTQNSPAQLFENGRLSQEKMKRGTGTLEQGNNLKTKPQIGGNGEEGNNL